MDDPRARPEVRCEREDALAVLKRLRESGHEAYFAGGCVRDQLLGLEPKDWDIATDAPPDRVRSLFSRTQAVGAAFGVVLVRHARSVIEVATFRSDLAYEDGRRPSGVRFTTAEEDARRRDFTINGLLLDPIENRVIDYVGGQADLAARRLRAIGDPSARFEEDHLRMLRAVRFAARFELSIDAPTADAIRLHAGKLRRISPERIGEELRLMLTAITRPRAWSLLRDLGLMGEVFRVLGPATAGKALLFPAISPGESIDFGLALAAAILCYRRQAAGGEVDPVSLLAPKQVRADLRAMRQTIKTSNDEHEQAEQIMLDIPMLLASAEPSVAQLKRFLAGLSSAQTRHLLDAIAAVGWHGERIAQLRGRLQELQKQDVAPAPLVSGDDLIATGLTPGPAFKRILDLTYDAQLEGRITDKPQALAHAMALAADRT
jgi:tRNA nucleotidyltransferase/poly(A) polymerase